MICSIVTCLWGPFDEIYFNSPLSFKDHIKCHHFPGYLKVKLSYKLTLFGLGPSRNILILGLPLGMKVML